MALTNFRLRELEEKMRKAAQKEDYETAIELRDEVRLMRERLSEADALKGRPKVVEIGTKAAYVAPEEMAENAELGADLDKDDAAVDLLLKAIEEYKLGFRFGLILLSGARTPDGIIRDVFTEATSPVLEHITLFTGALDLSKTDIAEGLWLEEADEDFDD